ncbi:MAG: hypothetical protein KatS3mg077_3127 [Candidatus Binatia bacterium]|nr:MAG: hypothetical protein KatS3mg077_3127 [Candidatus Binatia bacterium]
MMQTAVLRVSVRGFVSVAVATFVGAWAVAASGQTLPNYPSKAPAFNAWMARAFDSCTPSGLTVVSPTNVPNTGCLSTNSVTDSVLPFNFARLRVAKSGKIRLFARGLTFGESVRVRLALRVTRKGVNTKNPTKSNATVTFADVTVDCPAAPNAFVVRPNGAIVGATDLNACLAPNSNLGGGTGTNNIEVLGASLVNVATGKEFARAGVLR